MIDFVRFYFQYRTSNRLTNPETLIKVNIQISSSVKTYQFSRLDMTQPS